MGFGEDESVIKEEIQDHYDNGGEDEGAGGEDKFISEREVDCAGDIKNELVEWGEEAEKLDESGIYNDGNHGVPDEESND